ncbi:hypothetical protein [Lentiprolixibacter aurantiacus]|uniref:PepSY domain-containing protein n=1 Tax=Lentiprolixibacter aurantiacus TaxID=2993939 RepID=A0AAE3MIW0_9FLAO|nr:hypothetical protein [Lentiprolixibacter aurantiacus]MCX2718249.1 hypothetical protein [Lentiprolixibacter aurantiacus]
MKKYSFYLSLLLLLLATAGWSQNKYEREFRIKKSQFPENAHAFLKDELQNAKRIRYYKEVDSSKVSYEVKFKKERLFYSIEFDASGELEDVEILIKEADMPNSSYEAIDGYLKGYFTKYRIRKIQQQYTLAAFGTVSSTLKNAFQNMIDPKINYELIVGGATDASFQDYEILFDSEGNFISMRKSLPANYDHVLY